MNNPFGPTQSFLFPVAVAIAIGAVCLYVFESPYAFLVGTVIVLGTFCAARAVLDPGRSGGRLVSLDNLIDIFMAVAVLLTVGSFFGRPHFVPRHVPVAVSLGAFYIVKLAITYIAHSHKILAAAAYLVTLIVFATWFGNDDFQWAGESDWNILMGIYCLMSLFIVPTASFVRDFQHPRPPSARVAIWRSVGEMTILIPICYMFVFAVFTAIVMWNFP